MVGEILFGKLLKGGDIVDEFERKCIFGMIQFVFDCYQIIFRYSSSLTYWVNHVIFDNLDPFVGDLFLSIVFLDELVPNSSWFQFWAHLLVLYS